MGTELTMLLATSISVSVLHTVSGPDHFIPFIAIGRSKGWKLPKTLFWTVLCGIAHVLTSVVLALLVAGMGLSLSKFSILNEVRGGIASWLLLIFGILYFLYGLYGVYRKRIHKHFDVYDDGSVYVFEHDHNQMVYASARKKVTPWILFIIFLLGPCEALFPLLTYPAVQGSNVNMLLLIVVFMTCTVLTMMIMVTLFYFGFELVKFNWLEKYMAPIAGASITVCGAGMVFLQW